MGFLQSHKRWHPRNENYTTYNQRQRIKPGRFRHKLKVDIKQHREITILSNRPENFIWKITGSTLYTKITSIAFSMHLQLRLGQKNSIDRELSSVNKNPGSQLNRFENPRKARRPVLEFKLRKKIIIQMFKIFALLFKMFKVIKHILIPDERLHRKARFVLVVHLAYYSKMFNRLMGFLNNTGLDRRLSIIPNDSFAVPR